RDQVVYGGRDVHSGLGVRWGSVGVAETVEGLGGGDVGGVSDSTF
ncbi:hypothetical protein L195_g063435, partial [Trifolium pratense]